MADQKIEGIVTGFQSGAGISDTATGQHGHLSVIRLETPSGLLTTWVKTDELPYPVHGVKVSGTLSEISTLRDNQQNFPSENLLTLSLEERA
jgi:hypothetical protein